MLTRVTNVAPNLQQDYTLPKLMQFLCHTPTEYCTDGGWVNLLPLWMESVTLMMPTCKVPGIWTSVDCQRGCKHVICSQNLRRLWIWLSFCALHFPEFISGRRRPERQQLHREPDGTQSRPRPRGDVLHEIQGTRRSARHVRTEWPGDNNSNSHYHVLATFRWSLRKGFEIRAVTNQTFTSNSELPPPLALSFPHFCALERLPLRLY